MRAARRPARRLALLALLALATAPAAAQLSAPLAADAAADPGGNKFRAREAAAAAPPPPDEAPDARACPGVNLAVRWHAEVGDAVYATPLITDLFSDGRKDVIVPGLRHALAALEGRDGARAPGFEPAHRSALHASPLLYDVDLDGVPDVLVATYDGEVHFFRDSGEPAAYRLAVPRLRVARDWFAGLNPNPVDHSRPDVGAGADDSGRGERGDARGGAQAGGGAQGGGAARRRRSLLADVDAAGAVDGGAAVGAAAVGGAAVQGAEPGRLLTDEAAASFHSLFDETGEGLERAGGEGAAGGEGGAEGGGGRKENAEPFLDDELAYDVGEEADYGLRAGGGAARPARPPGAAEADAAARANLERNRHAAPDDPPPDAAAADAHAAHDMHADYALHHGDYGGMHGQWDRDWDWGRGAAGDLDLKNAGGADAPPRAHVDVDPHIMATPALGDLDGAGRPELVLSVSYFFDPGAYAADSRRAAAAVGLGGDVGDYVASGVVVYDLRSRVVRWSQHLDLSTARTRFQARALASPVLADIDGDGRLEVIVGTSMGFLYVLSGATGEALPGWPVQLGEITGAAAVGDLDGDGKLEIVAADARGSVAALRADGSELWERHLGGAAPAGATLADVDGDGRLEIVLGLADGRVHVLDGRSGADKLASPFRTFGRIFAPVLPVRLHGKRGPPGLHLAAAAADGYLYVIDPAAGCAGALDLGEASYAMVLADDLGGAGRLDLLATTVGGNVYAVATGARFHPAKAWPAQAPGAGAAGCTARWRWEGVWADAASRTPRDVRGAAVAVRFEVLDRRPLSDLPGVKRGPYKISVTLVGVGAKEMGAGDAPVIGMADVVNKTGIYTLEVPTPRTRTAATLRVEMVDESGAVFSDEFALSFHVHFYRLLKWLSAAPLVLCAAAALALGGGAGGALRELPS
jgi:hypothetical protein